MISHIAGKVKQKKENSLIIEAGNICYEVFVPAAIMKSLVKNLSESDGFVNLITFHYLHVEPSRSVPVLIGFLNEIEKEFFEKFITVSGVGPRAALKALNLPISAIADAIDSADISLLTSLPGIGTQRAKEIIAKLQGKVGKFGLIKDKAYAEETAGFSDDIKEEALEVLLQLQYKKSEADRMLAQAFQRNPSIKNCEELLNEVYKQKGYARNGR